MKATIGKHMRELTQVASQANSIETSVRFVDGKQTVTIEVAAYGSYNQVNGRIRHNHTNSWANDTTIDKVMSKLVANLGDDIRLDPNSITSKSSKSQVKGHELKELCFLAWHELVGLKPPSKEQLAQQRKIQSAAKSAERVEARKKRSSYLKMLETGDVQAWNRNFTKAKAWAPYRKLKCSGLDLTAIKLLDMPEGDFSSVMAPQAVAKKCNLSKTNWTKAVLRGAEFSEVNLEHANFRGADLSQAQLTLVKLKGADFSGAQLNKVIFRQCYFDESTRWPQGDIPSSGLVWWGKGPNPAELAALEAEKKNKGPVDLDTFMQRLKKGLDASRLDKALKMLKKDSFQLFVDITEDNLTGVVKSQTDPDLVYSCRLTAQGNFGCCTQNLNVCGGLRGSLCKHLLVLVVGMANAGDVDADTLDDWVQRSLLHKPALDKDAMSAILLKYKGADAGEIDWRPTETVPEDFYAL